MYHQPGLTNPGWVWCLPHRIVGSWNARSARSQPSTTCVMKLWMMNSSAASQDFSFCHAHFFGEPFSEFWMSFQQLANLKNTVLWWSNSLVDDVDSIDSIKSTGSNWATRSNPRPNGSILLVKPRWRGMKSTCEDLNEGPMSGRWLVYTYLTYPSEEYINLGWWHYQFNIKYIAHVPNISQPVLDVWGPRNSAKHFASEHGRQRPILVATQLRDP